MSAGLCKIGCVNSRLDLADQREADLLMGRLAGHLLACVESYALQCESCPAGRNGAVSEQVSWCCVAKRVASLELPAVGREDFLAALGGLGLPDGWPVDVEQTYWFYTDQAACVHFGDELAAEFRRITELGADVDAAAERITSGDSNEEAWMAYNAAMSRLDGEGRSDESLTVRMKAAGLLGDSSGRW